MKRSLAAMVFLVATVAFAKDPVNDSHVKIKDSDEKGVPTFVTGELGQLGPGAAAQSAKAFLKSQKALLKMQGSEDFDVVSSSKDSLGQTHTKMRQTLRGLPVVGAEYIVHADANGNVFAMNGRFAPDLDLPRNATVDSIGAINRAAAQLGAANAKITDRPSLTYVVNERSNAFLAWTATVEYTNAEGYQLDRVYADATTGDLVLDSPTIHRARNRATYNVNNGTSLPGTLVMSETSAPSSDVSIAKAHEYAGVTYDYYYGIHSRDSYNNAGGQLRSSVHYSSGYNNAFWNGAQMVYGDGDGSQFGPFSRALDVVAHELTHAVTETTANLVYSYESGALNEATSDILGVAAEAWKYGVIDSRTWKVGEDCYTPATAGDALRYMNNPTADGYSRDYYPERITTSGDNGGVHGNSGIANLAVYLMTVGGTHPRGKTTVSVTALDATQATSLNMAAKIWYRALTVYMTSSTNFAAARTATMQAATDLYGAAASTTVGQAWAAVGVGSTGGGGTTSLTNGVAVTNISGATGSWNHYKITVPSGQSKLEIIQSGGTGDADLYVRLGAQPTLSTYNYRPYLGGNNETVTVTNPAAGDWYISIYGYASYSGVSLKATYSTTTTPTCTSVTASLSGTGATYYAPTSSGYTSSISGTHTGKLTGPSTADFDLYLQKWNGSSWAQVAAGESSTSTENVTYNGTSGSYRWRVYSYSGSGTFTLCTTKP